MNIVACLDCHNEFVPSYDGHKRCDACNAKYKRKQKRQNKKSDVTSSDQTSNCLECGVVFYPKNETSKRCNTCHSNWYQKKNNMWTFRDDDPDGQARWIKTFDCYRNKSST